ncbi:tail fiber protein [Sphingomonas phage Scott]|uniref:Tail fiber protein n=1 Tax=Sphingomonas phage Scott TaxID=2282912 RepID=A0A346FDC1_9CAUD|nr:tail fiber protein [Sphingomonas phage Scott]AXN53735.1 tail fiber protein [Sphingomonas phage Scott]
MADTDLYSVNIFPGNGTQTNFEISFAGGYISREHVKAYLRIGQGAETPVSLEWMDDNVVRYTPAPPLNSVLVVYRETPKDKPLADFSNGAVLTESSLDINAKQAVFIAAEAQDNGTERITNVEKQSIKSVNGGLVGSGFVVVGSDGVASGQDFLNIVKTATPVADDGAWGSAFADDGVWG